MGAALLVVVALGYQYIPISGADSPSTASKSSKKKNKKKSKGTGTTGDANGHVDGDRTEASILNSSAKRTSQKGDVKAAPIDHATSDPAAEPAKATKPKTLAQKIAPQPRKSKVDE